MADENSLLADGRPVTMERIWTMLQYQAESTKRIEDMMKEKSQSNEGQERRTTAMYTQLAIHKVLLYIAGTLFLTFMPIMVTWNFSLRTELQSLHSTTDTLNEKTRLLERVLYKLPDDAGRD